MKIYKSKNVVVDFLKRNFLFFLMIAFIFWSLSPALSLLLQSDYAEFNGVISVFGNYSNNIKITNQPISYFFSQYASITFLSMLAYKIFGFNSIYYYAFNIFLRILVSSSIYFFVAKWCKSKFAGLIAGTYFGVSYPGIQVTTRVTLYITYLAAFFMIIFIDRWFQFHEKPNVSNARISIVSLIISILVFPIRMAGMVILLFSGELYWLVSKYNDKKNLRLRLKHTVSALISLAILIIITGTLKQTPELQFKMVSLIILARTLLTGIYPSIYTFWLFISNLIISPVFFTFKLIPYSTFDNSGILLPILSTIVFFIFIIKRKYSLALISLTAILYPFFVNLSIPHLTFWQKFWIVSTKYGGTLFLLSFVTTLYIYGKNKINSQVGLLGISILISNIIFAWMLAPVYLNNQSQSAFDFAIRYYTLPSAGMALIVASLSSFFIKSINISIDKYNIKNLITTVAKIFPLALIASIVFLNSLAVRKTLIQLGTNINARKVDKLWNLLNKNVDPSGDSPKLVYIEYSGTLEEEGYIKSLFPTRFSVITGKVDKPPQITYIFNKDEISQKLSANNQNSITQTDFYAFKIDGNNLIDIKNEFNVNHNEK